MDEQQKVETFIRENDMNAVPVYRLLDLVSEVGEVAKDAAESTDYGDAPETLEINSDEIGDALFSLLAFADSVDVDAGKALDEAIEKYEDRITETDTASSGN